jgi:F-type H+-transporting ATPase subunit delta
MPQSHSQVETNAVAEVYARSLLELADEAGGEMPEAVGDELNQIVELMEDQPELRKILQDPAVRAPYRAESIQRLFKGQASDLTYRFLQVLNTKGRLGELDNIAHAVAAKLKQRRGEFDVDVYTAHPLSQEQAAQVADRLGKAMGGTALLNRRVDPSMVGGLKLRIGDRLIDGSLSTRLQQMRRSLHDRTHEAVRQRAEAMISEEA